MHYKSPSPILNPNQNPDSDLVSYYSEMPTCEDLDPYPVESPAQGNPSMSFASKCMGDGLEDQSLFNTPFSRGRTNT